VVTTPRRHFGNVVLSDEFGTSVLSQIRAIESL